MEEPEPEISVGVVIPAAGSGTRLGGRRKQFRLLDGKPLFVQTASVFETHDQVQTVVIVVSEEDVTGVSALVHDHRLTKVTSTVAGGSTRHESVRNGVKAIPDDVGIILTHDAVRPFITESDVSRLIAEVRRTGAAALAAPLSDTLVRAPERIAGETVPRSELFRMLTPQGFSRDILIAAHDLAARSGRTYTDEVTLVRAGGHDVTLVEGNPVNIKITTPADWILAQWMWPAFRAWRDSGAQERIYAED